MIGEFNEVKGRYPVRLESGEAVLIKMMNLVAIGDDQYDDDDGEADLARMAAACRATMRFSKSGEIFLGCARPNTSPRGFGHSHLSASKSSVESVPWPGTAWPARVWRGKRP